MFWSKMISRMRVMRFFVAKFFKLCENMPMSEETIPERSDDDAQKAEIARRVYHELDLLETAIRKQEILDPLIIEVAGSIRREIDVLCFDESAHERVMQKVDTIIAMTNDPHVHEIRKLLEGEGD